MAKDGTGSARLDDPLMWAGVAVVLVAVGVTAGVLATRSSSPPPRRRPAHHPRRRPGRFGPVRPRPGQSLPDAPTGSAEHGRVPRPLDPGLSEPGGARARPDHVGAPDELPPRRRPAGHQRRRGRCLRQHGARHAVPATAPADAQPGRRGGGRRSGRTPGPARPGPGRGRRHRLRRLPRERAGPGAGLRHGLRQHLRHQRSR